MDEHRAILVAFSAICGCILLLFAVWHTAKIRRSNGSWRRGLGVWVYAGLFFIASLILWTREHTHSNPPSVPQSHTSSVSTAESATGKDKVDSGGLQNEKSLLKPDSIPGVFQESPIKSGGEIVVDERISLSRRDFRPTASARALDIRQISQAAPKSIRSVDEIIYSAVSHTFDAIENWFALYATATEASDQAVRRRPVRNEEHNIAHLPPIVFVPNTAELTTESESALRKIAGFFKSQANTPVIEIQARTESAGPEPYNYILTQARAEVVRDFLMKEGVNTNRLIARAMGSSGADSTAPRSHISFVVQR